MPGLDFSIPDDVPPDAKILEVRVQAPTPSLWSQHCPQFVRMIRELVDELDRDYGNAYFSDKAEELTRPMMEQAVRQLALQETTHEQAAAFDRITSLFANRPDQKPVTLTKKQSLAEAREERIGMCRKRLLSVLIGTRACVVDSQDILIGQSINALIKLVKMVGRAS